MSPLTRLGADAAPRTMLPCASATVVSLSAMPPDPKPPDPIVLQARPPPLERHPIALRVFPDSVGSNCSPSHRRPPRSARHPPRVSRRPPRVARWLFSFCSMAPLDVQPPSQCLTTFSMSNRLLHVCSAALSSPYLTPSITCPRLYHLSASPCAHVGSVSLLRVESVSQLLSRLTRLVIC